MVCSGDDDYYTLSVPDGQQLTVSIAFLHSDGDLDLAIFQGSQQLDSSESTGDSESVTVSGGGDFTVHVFGYNSAAASYSVSASVN